MAQATIIVPVRVRIEWTRGKKEDAIRMARGICSGSTGKGSGDGYSARRLGLAKQE